MKKLILAVFALFISCNLSYGEGAKPRVVLLISEQNIEGPQRAWWASEIDLSATEAAVAEKLIAAGYDIIEPSSLTKIVRQDPAFRIVNLSEADSIKLGSLSKADYLVLGKAVASSGSNVPQSSMRSCFANITAKLINIKDGKVVAYLDASGNSAHMDVITGGKEALVSAAGNLSVKLIDALNKKVEAGQVK
jgi:hypothetical protein